MNSFSWDTTGMSPNSNTGIFSDFQFEWMKDFPASNEWVTLLAPTVADSITDVLEIANEPNYSYLAKVHAELIEAGKTSEEIARWTGEALGITAWKEGRFYGKRGALSTPDTAEERIRFQKFIEALGVSYDAEKGMKYIHANGPSKTQPQYFLLDGFVQNAWLGRDNMLKRDKKLSKMNNTLVHMKDIKVRAQYVYDKIGHDVGEDWSQCNIGYRTPLSWKWYYEGIFIGWSLVHEEGEITKRVYVLWIGREKSDFYDNTAATWRMCFLR